MSKDIDERVVQMKFDNKQFEANIKTSTNSLDNLKKSLKLEGATKGLNDLDKAGKTFSLSGMAQSVDYIANRFSAMGIIGITALQNITNSAINAGKTLVKSLTVDPIKMGLNEYETKMNAITTILTNTESKGTTLKQVNDTLNELNKYADQTIYNFAEMTRNIGTFTAAGIDLNTSASAIKGIANLAAGSGSNAQQASTAMYQLSQALAAGKVSLMDWNSVVNAGMGGELFKKNLLETAKGMKAVKTETVNGQEMVITYTKKGKKELKTFRESLEDGWLTSKVLISTLEKFAKDKSLLKAATQVKTFTQLIDTMKESVQSGWAQSWENIIGDREEAAEVFTAVNDAFGSIAGASADARNEMLAFWKANGGRSAIIQGISNAFKGLQALLKPVSEAFREVFPAMTGQRLVEISNKFRDLTAKFKIGAETAANIKLTFKGLFAVLDIGVKAFQLVAGGIGLFVKALFPVSGSLIEMTAKLGGFFIRLNDTIEQSGLMTKILSKMGSGFVILKENINKSLLALGPTLSNVKDMIVRLSESFIKLFRGTTVFAEGLDSTHDSFSNTESNVTKLKLAFDKLVDFIVNVKNAIVTVAKAIAGFLVPVFDSIKKKFDQFTLQDFGALLTGGGLLMFAKTLAKGLSSVDGILENFNGILSQVGNTLKAFQLKVKAQALLTIAIALGVLAGALFVLSKINGADLAKSLGALTLVFAELIGGLILINKFTGDIKKVTGQMIALGIGMMLLAYSVKTLASMDADKLKQGVTALASLMGVIALFIKITKGGDLKASAGGLIAFSVGIMILTGSLAILGNINPNKLIQGVTAISTLMGVIALFINLTRGGDLKGSAGGLMGFATGIIILTGALTILGNLDASKLTQGVAAISTLMLVLVAFINATKSGDLMASAGGLMGFATGITILVGALAILGNMDDGKLIQGSVAIITMMTAIAMFINLTRGGDLKASAGGLIGFSIGITLLTFALSRLADLETGKLIQGVTAISSLMTAIGVFITVTKGGDLKASAAGLVGFAVGLTVLTGAVALLAAIKPERLVQGVTAVVVMMTAIGAFINLTKEGDLKKSASGLIGFATGLMILAGVIAVLSALNTEKLMMASVALSTLMASIAMFVNVSKGTDMVKTSIGLIAFSAGIAIMAASLVEVAKLDPVKIVAAGSALTALMVGIIAFVKLTNGINLLTSSVGLVIFAGALSVLAKVITTLGSTDVKTLLVGMGALAATLVILGLTAFILAPLTPVIISLSAAIVLFGIGCLAVGAGMLAFATGMAILAESGKAGADALVVVITSIIGLIPLALTTLAIGLVGFVKTIGDSAPVVAEAFMKVLNVILDTATIMIPKIVDSGIKIVLGFLKGIRDNIAKVVATGIDIVVQFLKGVSSKIGDISDTAFKVFISFIDGLASAIDNNHDAIYAACRKLIHAIIEVIVDFVPNMIEVGKDVVRGFIKGITSMDKSLRDTANGMFSGAVDGIKRLLGIHSPSTVFASIGKFSALGFAGGLKSYAGSVLNAATDVGYTAMDSLKNAMTNMSQVVNDNMDTNPTIRPVLDLSNVTAGAGMINSMLSKNQSISVSSANSKAALISKSMQRNVDDSQNGSSTPIQVPEVSNPKPVTLQLMLQNGKAIAEFVVDDIDNLVGNKNKITGRAVGVW